MVDEQNVNIGPRKPWKFYPVAMLMYPVAMLMTVVLSLHGSRVIETRAFRERP